MASGTRLGSYWPTESFWHSRDPRTLLLTTLLILGLTLLFSSLLGQVLILFITTFLYTTAHLPLKSIPENIRAFKWILLLTFLANLIYPNVFSDNSQIFTRISVSTFLTLRIINMILISFWLTMTVRVITLMNTIGLALQPFKHVLPIDQFVLAMGVAIRFFPILQEESEEIILAQRARSNGEAARGLKAVNIVIPLLVGALRRAQEMATAIESRGYRIGQIRTIWPVSQWSTKETWVLTMIILSILFMIFFYHYILAMSF